MRDVTDAWKRFANRASLHLRRTLEGLRPAEMPDDGWDRYTAGVVLPLAELIRMLDPAIVGLSGPPGSGKSTLARQLAAVLSDHDRRALALSMDDFYLSRAERAAKGLRWRGGPGSHDLPLLIEVLEQVRAGRTPITIPRYSALADDRAEPETLDLVGRPLILEGWFLGYSGDGYGEILEHIDLLVFIDIDIETARERRFGREQKLRDAGGGFSADDMQHFWDEVLEPGIERLVPEARRMADLVVAVDRDDRLRSVEVGEARADSIVSLLETARGDA